MEKSALPWCICVVAALALPPAVGGPVPAKAASAREE
jgi:hypothetical protein